MLRAGRQGDSLNRYQATSPEKELLFNSVQYLTFLVAVVAVCWLLPRRIRPVFLLSASYIFYASWNPPYLLLISGLTLANYILGMLQGRTSTRSNRILFAAIAINLLTLAIFKYLGFMDDTARRVAAILGIAGAPPAVQLLLPLGLSFFAFEFIHYQVDLARGGEPIRNPLRFALFPAFFPTQIAGPIKRYQDFDRQVQSLPRFDPALFAEGIELILIGLFKKVVLADNLLPLVDRVFSHPAAATSLDVWAALLAFSLQIYFDFSGYTDIGRGSAQLLGYTVPQNFNAPYLATSIRDFWRRWHMTLSNWLRDYLYIPLGGSRRGKWRVRLHLLITMSLGGLWHGAAWHFVAWGFGHGLALVTNHALDDRKIRLPRLLGVLVGWATTQLTVLFLWSIFRAPNLPVVAILWRHAVSLGLSTRLLHRSEVGLVCLVGAALLLTQLLLRATQPRERLVSAAAGVVLRPAFILLLAGVTYYFAIAHSSPHRFIYFQF